MVHVYNVIIDVPHALEPTLSVLLVHQTVYYPRIVSVQTEPLMMVKPRVPPAILTVLSAMVDYPQVVKVVILIESISQIAPVLTELMMITLIIIVPLVIRIV